MPAEVDEKTDDLVAEVLESKHPSAKTPDVSVLTDYPRLPDFVDLDITDEAVEKVARRLSGSAGSGGTDSHALQHWLLRFGKASGALRDAVADFTDWLGNTAPPWAAYQAIMAGRLIGIDKCPGVRPVGAGETWRRLFAKTILLVAGAKPKKPVGQTSCVLASKPVSRAGFTPSSTSGLCTRRKKNGDFFSLMHLMHSTS
jgi:hypothetical protein